MAENPLTPIWMTEPGQWDFRRASHLLQRAGFGGTTAEINTLVAAGPQQAVQSLVNYQAVPDNLPPMQFGDLAGPAPATLRNAFRPYRDLNEEQRKSLNQLRIVANYAKMEEVRRWWLDRMVRTQRPLEEKMTLFWHGLLVSGESSVRNTYHLYLQNQLYRGHATGNIRELIMQVSKDPAMLDYLNNNQNRKEHPNENYARELMELFTMGIGNYTEQDIKESARAFTGWTFLGDRFVFNTFQHDNGIKTFLGRTGNFDGHDIVNIIFESPATSRYYAMRLVRFFGMDEPTDDRNAAVATPMIDALARLVRKENYNLQPVLTALFSSNWFYSTEVMRRQIKSPVQLVVGGLRFLDVYLDQPGPVSNSLKLMGQELFNAPNVKGWDGGRAWISTSTLFSRYNLPAYLVTGRLPTGGQQQSDDPDIRNQFLDFHSGWSPQNDLADANVCTTDGVVDLYVKKLIQDKIEPRKRDALVESLNRTGDAKTYAFDPVAPDAEARLRTLVHLIMMMPEYQIA
jgi:uncharacterized protein (DUF1800 family)